MGRRRGVLVEARGEARTLVCAACQATYPLAAWFADRAYRCGRCQALIEGASPSLYGTLRERPSDDVFLYARPDEPASGAPETTTTGSRAAPTAEALAGLRRVGRYAILSELGRGGMGVVYHAWDTALSRHVALKVLISGEHAGSEQMQRFLREARAAAQLDHPNVVRVHDIGEDGAHAYFTMDLVHGPSLQQVIDAGQRLPPREAARIIAAVGRGLHEAHRHGLVHRDVKPGNVLLRVDGTPQLADFGVAGQIESVGTRLTRSGQLLGTPAYMAPEQAIDGSDATDARSDQYALAAVLYELLAGVPPYPGDSAMAVIVALISGPPKPLREVAPGVPRDLDVIVGKALARDAPERYASVLDLSEDLGRWLAGQPILARPPSWSMVVRQVTRRHGRTLRVAVGGLLALAVGGLGAWGWSTLQAQRAAAAREAQAEVRWAAVADRMEAAVAEGREADADAALRVFVEAPEHRGTQVAARAWLAHAQRKAESGAIQEAIDAYASAYAGAPSVERQDEALFGLAETFERVWRHDALAVVVDTLIDRAPDRVTDARVARWSAQTRLALRDLGGAAARLGPADPARPALEALLGATRVPQLDGKVYSAPAVDATGSGMLVVPAPGTVRVVAGTPGLPVLAQLPFSDDDGPFDRLKVVDGPTLRMITQRGTHNTPTALYAVDPQGGLSREASWVDDAVGDAVAGDLDGDGHEEVYVGIGPYARRLLRVDPRDGSVGPAHPPTDAAASDITGLALGDLSGDGAPELVVAAGAWGAYDLRVLAQGEAGALERVARRKMGFIHDVRVVPGSPARVLVAKGDVYPNRVMFPANAPFGEPSGVYLLRLEGGELVTDAFFPNPAPRTPDTTSSIPAAWMADMDGDGRLDVVAALIDQRHGPHTLLFRALPEGGYATLVIGGMTPRVSAQLDDDPALELLVQLHGEGESEQTWALGVGSSVIPVKRQERPALAEPPPMRDALLARTWARAEDLVRMGLVAQGAAQLEGLASWTDDPTLQARARVRAAELREVLGDDALAAELYLAAERSPATMERALEGATVALTRAHRFAAAADVASRWMAAGGGAPAESAAAALAPLASVSDALTIDFAAGLPPTLSVHDPVALRHEPGGLRFEIVGTDDDVFSVPFDWSGRRLGLVVDVDLERVEWAGGFQVSLVPPTGPAIAVAARGWGGGDVLERELLCDLTSKQRIAAHRAVVDGAEAPIALRLTVDVAATTDDVLCQIETRDGEVLVRHRGVLGGPLPPGRWSLRFGASKHATLDTAMVSSGLLRRVEVAGAQAVADASPDPALRAWVMGDPDLALGLGLGDTPARAVWRAQALAEVGAFEEAGEALAAALAASDPAAEREVEHLLRARIVSFAPLLSERVGLDYPAWFDRAWSGAIYAHHRDDRVRRMLTTQLGGLDQALRRPHASLDAEVRTVVLLIARGRAWMGLGEVASARRDLRLAASVTPALLERLPVNERADVRGRLSQVYRSLAALDAASGDLDSAWRNVEQALRFAAAPELALDAMANNPELAALRADPAWAELAR